MNHIKSYKIHISSQIIQKINFMNYQVFLHIHVYSKVKRKNYITIIAFLLILQLKY